MRFLALAIVIAVTALAAAGADASSPPVGPLPAGTTSTISTRAGQLVAVALPHRSGGRVWRIARAYDPRVIRELSEADVGQSVVIVFKAARAGNATLVFALTKAETSKALEARRFAVRIR